MSFRMWGHTALATMTLAATAAGQIELTWTLRHNRAVLLEPIRATVTIANYTGQTLDLSPRGNAKLLFDVEEQPTLRVPATGQPLVPNPLRVPPHETREVEVNLLDGYRILKGQTYMIRPVLEFAGTLFFGERRALEVLPGLELLHRRYGMPGSSDAREISLRLIHRDRSDRLFFRIDNPKTGFCLGVYELGRVIRLFTPRLEQDRSGHFHVLHQSGPDRFTHSVFSLAGEPLETAIYAGEVGAMQLVREDDGFVGVRGGTAFEEDPENPGMLIAPALPPAHPYQRALGEIKPTPAPPGGRPTPQPSAKQPSRKTGKNHAGSEPVSW